MPHSLPARRITQTASAVLAACLVCATQAVAQIPLSFGRPVQPAYQPHPGAPAAPFSGRAPQAPAGDQPYNPTARARMAPTPFAWRVLGTTGEGRPIEFAQFGTGRRHILVIGPLAGDQTAALGMVDKLTEYLAAAPAPLADITLTVVRDPNPDGRARRVRFNGRGVDLDRNFSTTNWQRLAEGAHVRSGTRPHSEPETRALASLVADLRPERIVAVTSAGDQAGLGWAGPGSDLARALSEELALPLDAQAAQPAGSLAAYAADERGIPILAFGVPAGWPTLDNWSALGRGLMTAVGLASPEPRRLPAADTPLEPMPGSDAPSIASPSVPRRQGPFSGRTKALPASSGRLNEESRPTELVPPASGASPVASPLGDAASAPGHAARTPAPSTRGAAPNAVSDLADSLDLGGWKPSSPSPAAKSQAAPARGDTYWPANRIQRLPPVDRVE